MIRSLSLGTIAAVALLAASCGDECNSSLDCERGQVCYGGSCTAVQGATRKCARDEDCNGMSMTDNFQCVVGLCVIPTSAVSDVGISLPDGGAGDGSTPADSGTPPADSGTPPADSGTPPADSGTPPADSGTPPADSGMPPADSGTPPADSGTPPADSGTPADAGVVGDAGTSSTADAGLGADTGIELDGGALPDAGLADVGTFLTSDHMLVVPADGATGDTVGGIAGARDLCRAVTSGIAGRTNWEPLLTDGTFNFYTLPFRGPIVNFTGAQIAPSITDLRTGRNPGTTITNETGQGLGGAVVVWTGVLPDGTPSANNCTNWTSAAGGGEMGIPMSTGAAFLSGGQIGCSTRHSFYCVSFGP